MRGFGSAAAPVGRGRGSCSPPGAAARRLRRHDLGALGGVGGEHAVVADEVPPRRWHDRGQARDEVERLEHDGVGAVLPRLLERVAHAPAVVLFEALGRERRARDVADEALEARSVTTVEGDLGVHVDAVDVRVGARARALHHSHGAHELGGALAGARACPP
ncbi:MAG: hypothetical protein U0234_32100 [Sandaracinus sp.]